MSHVNLVLKNRPEDPADKRGSLHQDGHNGVY